MPARSPVRRLSPVSSAALLIALCGCSALSSDPRPLSSADQAYVADLSNFVASDRQLVSHEMARTANPRMISLAAHLGSQANTLDRQLGPIMRSAARTVVTTPASTDEAAPALRAAYADGTIVVTADNIVRSDRDFLVKETSLHRVTLTRMQANASAHDSDPNVRFLSRANWRMVEWNLGLLQNAQAQVVASLD